jgi:hypothetical protein
MTTADLNDLLELADLACRTRRDREFVQRMRFEINQALRGESTPPPIPHVNGKVPEQNVQSTPSTKA